MTSGQLAQVLYTGFLEAQKRGQDDLAAVLQRMQVLAASLTDEKTE